VQFDTTLNVIWSVLSLLALAGTARSCVRRHVCKLWLHVMGMALILAALFPYISATDDVLRIDDLSAQLQQRTEAQSPGHHSKTPEHRRNQDLLRLFETMDHPVVTQPAVLAFSVFFVALVFSSVSRIIERGAPNPFGRSPPLPATL